MCASEMLFLTHHLSQVETANRADGYESAAALAVAAVGIFCDLGAT